MSNAIKWELLSEDELDFLDSVGVDRLPSAIEFSRTPSWDDYCLVFAYLVGLKKRIADDNNHIAFAIGDCLIAGGKLFGESTVDEWVKDFFKLLAKRDHILNMTGGTLIFLQQVELQVKLCCAMIPLEDLNLSLDDFFSPDPSRRRQTLGQLASALKQRKLFDSSFEERLTSFVKLRNEFVHYHWSERWHGSSRISGFPSLEEFDRTYDFIVTLIREAHYIRNVFRGLQYAMIQTHLMSSNSESDKLNAFDSWAKYIPEFRSVLRDKSP